ncbi:MAG: hypothetical protein K2L52_05445, partial [Clostridia bacterium]|nr:hypothetical protein [Clostridia bacterium]
MEKCKNKKKILTLLTIALTVVIVLSCVIGIFGKISNFNIGNDVLDNNSITPTSRPIISNTGSLSSFADGAKYVFTDKSKIDGFRAGTEQYDITTVEVDTSETIGTQKNPYVITSTNEWEIFVKRMETDATRGSGQYFVLGGDLDFDGVTFHPVRFFSGTFYGLGYSIKNITCATWQYYNGNTLTNIASTTYSFGLFCRLTDATVTDLIVDNFSYQNMPLTSEIGTDRASFTGGIAGMSSGNDFVLNCHTVGEIISTIKYNTWIPIGGIIGGKHNTGTATNPLLIYRCSSELDASLSGLSSSSTASSGPLGGGILGDGYNGIRNWTMYMYDCVSNLRFTTSSLHYIGGAMGLAYYVTYMENVVCSLDIISSADRRSGALMGSYTLGTKYLKNCYSDGKIGSNSSNKFSMESVHGSAQITSSNGNASNINQVKSSSAYASTGGGSGYGDCLSNYAGEPHEFSNSDLMLASAKTFFSGSQYSNIWDTSKIGGSYDPDNSPVRNYLVATITFKNLLSGDKEEDIASVPTDDYMQGDVLPSASNNANFASYIAS